MSEWTPRDRSADVELRKYYRRVYNEGVLGALLIEIALGLACFCAWAYYHSH